MTSVEQRLARQICPSGSVCNLLRLGINHQGKRCSTTHLAQNGNSPTYLTYSTSIVRAASRTPFASGSFRQEVGQVSGQFLQTHVSNSSCNVPPTLTFSKCSRHVPSSPCIPPIVCLRVTIVPIWLFPRVYHKVWS